MQPSIFLALMSGISALAMPAVSAEPRAASFTTWFGPGCDDSTSGRVEHQNIPSDVCTSLPGDSLKLWYTVRPSCQLRVFESYDCSGGYVPYSLPANRDQCKDISQKHTYKVVC